MHWGRGGALVSAVFPLPLTRGEFESHCSVLVSMALIDILEFAALTVLIMFLFLFLSILFEGLLIGPDKVPGVI